MAPWVQKWLPTIILPLLGLAAWAMGGWAAHHERVGLIEHDQHVFIQQKIPARVLTLEIQMQALRLTLEAQNQTILLLAEERLGRVTKENP